MLYRILQAYGGVLPDDVVVAFANTGKERPETLRFVHAVSVQWGIRIRWVEFRNAQVPLPNGGLRWRVWHEEVGLNSASRNGEPFDALIRQRQFLPNTLTRFCTTELKVRTMKRLMIAEGHRHWSNAVGIRADEPRRLAKGRAGNEARKERFITCWPLAEAGITEPMVLAFWGAQPFDLELRRHEGNCDLCFLKGQEKLRALMYDRPDLAPWWIGHEQPPVRTFRNNRRACYAALFATRRKQLSMIEDDDALSGCLVCGVG